MKFVGDTLGFSEVGAGESHTVYLPFYHRAAVGVFPGTRLFAVPLTATNEIVLTPIDPSTWADLWRLEATVSDHPGSAKRLVEMLVANTVNVLVHEGVSESTEDGKTVHQVFEVLDLARYANAIDGTSDSRTTVNRPLLKPNLLVNQLINHASRCLAQSRGRDGWELQFERMEFFFHNKGARHRAVELSLNVNKEVHVPAELFRDMSFVDDVSEPLPLHIISDTEQKYVKLRVLSPRKYYLLLEIEHAERVGAIDEFMGVLSNHDANMIDSYSRLTDIAHSAHFYALAEFPEMSAKRVLAVLDDLVGTPLARQVTLKGAAGAGPLLEKLKLPRGVSIREAPTRQAPTRRPARLTEASARITTNGPEAETGVGKATASALRFGAPYYIDHHDSTAWTLNTAQVFMAVPFAKPYEDFYNDFIASAVRDVGLEPMRIDEMPAQARRRHIVDKIEEAIARSRFVIADVSGWNPNVVYEVGLTVGISKPILLLCDKQHFDAREIPFDFQSYELIEYSPYSAGDLRSRLTRKIREIKDDTELDKVTTGA